MIVNYMSDLHLEFENEYPKLEKMDFPECGDVLILAGDITTSNFDDVVYFMNWLSNVSVNYDHILYVPGNHEYYEGSINEDLVQKLQDFMKEVYKIENVTILHNKGIEIDGVKFFGTTLWTDINNKNPLDMMNNNMLTDFKAIGGLNTKMFVEKHYEDIAKLKDAEADVIITHHAPSFQSCKDYQGDHTLDPFYASNLDKIVGESGAKFWIHGHIHNTVNYHIGDTNVVTNPRGYNFNPNLNFDIDKNFTI